MAKTIAVWQKGSSMIDAYRIREMLFEYGRKQREAENKVRIVNDNRSRNALRKYTDIVEVCRLALKYLDEK